MTQPRQRASGVELFEARRILFTEGRPPRLSIEHRRAMDRAWSEAVEANPNLFDGPVVACTGLEGEGSDTLVLSWARASYRYRALRVVPGAPPVASVFVGVVQPSDDGRLLVGRMSSSTVVPGRIQLPGGSMEPPGQGEPLDVAGLRRHAARELVEETGVDTPAEDLALWCVTRGEYGNVGFLFRAPSRPPAELHERFSALVSAETAHGHQPEFDRILLVRSAAELVGVPGPRMDYLETVVRRHAEEDRRRPLP
ncbi:NUDIX hydrolase [Streptomyces sp. NPDC059176]|uniref:NUDIX hydrolase n=1 Tax=unclassified Streptomyces TaxID=2593676 RepID=UPI0036B38A50